MDLDDTALDASLDLAGSAAGVTPLRLAVFCTVVESRSFTRAAEQLFLTRPAVSMHVRALETALGAVLFDRRQRGARLTEAGRATYDFAVGMRRDLADLRARLADLARGQAGTVTLGAVPTPGTYVLPELLTRFRRRQQGGRLRLQVLTSAATAEEVQRGRLDLGIVNEQIAVATGLAAEELWEEPMFVVARADHPLARRERVSVPDLAKEVFVVGPGRTIGDQALDAAVARAGLPARRAVLEVDTPEAAKQAVLAGAGLVVLFRAAAARELADGRLAILALGGPLATERFHLIYRRHRRFSPLAQALIAFLREATTAEPT
jgi:DNA-binding transcriptional LysR family regulator